MGLTGTKFVFLDAAKAPAAAVLLVPLTTKPPPALELVARVDALCGGAVGELIAVKAVGEEVGHLAHTTRAGAYRRVVVVSLGDIRQVSVKAIRAAAAGAAAWLGAAKITRAALWIDGLLATGVERAAAEWAGGMALAGFRFGEYKQPDKRTLGQVAIHVCAGEPAQVRRVLPDIREELTVADAVNYTRRLAHQPANIINPRTLAAAARKLAGGGRLRCSVLDTAQVRRLGMGGLAAVGAGAAHGPCLIQLEYRGAPRSRRLVVLIGKAITFDTGGYSIKPAAGLEGMKFDKSGGAAVLGVVKAVRDLKLQCNVVGLLAAAENAISGRAYRPGDILRMMSGKTVEVISTDAEGRLILADALWYAQKRFRPTELIDLATLTGGAVLALGREAAALLSNNDELAADLDECGRRVGERLWRLPLWDEYRELIKGTDAELRNSTGKRDAPTIVGGMFLKEFVADAVAWAHLDIAAVATADEPRPPTGKGATGFGVRLLVDYLRRRAVGR